MAKVMLTRPERKQGSTDDYVKQRRGVITGPPSPPPKGRGGVPVGPLFPALQQKEEKENNPLSNVLAALDQLSPDQRKEVLAKLALANQTTPSKHDRDLEMWVVAVHEGLQAAIGGGGRGLSGPAQMKRSLSHTSSWGSVQEFMKSSKLDQISVTERQSVYVMLAKLVIENARWISRKAGIPLSAKLVANCATNISGIFDQSFPGYLESGLTHLIAKQLTSPRYD